MYASIRQGKAKAGMVEELTRRIKEGAIPIISDVQGFWAYYVVYSPTIPSQRSASSMITQEPRSPTDARLRGLSKILRRCLPGQPPRRPGR